MLTHLTIENYALIDHLKIDFYKGFSAITGETGAGKSILVDALDLVLGKRADNQFLLNPNHKCVVEAVFSIANYNLNDYFNENGLDYDEFAILRREVSLNGKSRAFVNDTPVNLSQLKQLGDLLVDIHAQHATSSLHDPAYQLSVIDSFAGLLPDVAAYNQRFLELKKSRELLNSLVIQEENSRAALDYKQFLMDELIAADLKPGEQEHSEEILTMMTHAEEIKSALFQVQGLLNEDEFSCLNLLSQAESSLQKISAYHPGLEPQLLRLKSAFIDLQDISMELSRLNESVEFSPEQLDETRQRLDLIFRLQHKHHANSIDELKEIAGILETELLDYSSLGSRIDDLEEDLKKQEDELAGFADLLSHKRRQALPSLETEIISSLKHMGIPEARFEIRHELTDNYRLDGHDRIGFYFNANEGHALKPLSDIASGGELSRVMLSIKSAISDKKLLPTILFDEIDNGLSGDIAGRVGDMLANAASRMQVIAVTHLPQIAGKAQNHYSVFKHSKNNVTYSNIKFLDHKERVTELAKMIGGREITAASIAAAEELLTLAPKMF
jgi:DNA repair protein RecN (Recombination protein N)